MNDRVAHSFSHSQTCWKTLLKNISTVCILVKARNGIWNSKSGKEIGRYCRTYKYLIIPFDRRFPFLVSTSFYVFESYIFLFVFHFCSFFFYSLNFSFCFSLLRNTKKKDKHSKYQTLRQLSAPSESLTSLSFCHCFHLLPQKTKTHIVNTRLFCFRFFH